MTVTGNMYSEGSSTTSFQKTYINIIISNYYVKITHVYTNFDIEEERIVKLSCFEISIIL